MNKARLIEILSEWNFWGKGLDIGIVRRDYLTRIINFLEGRVNKIISLYGVRRSGKSYILRQVADFLSEKYGENNVLYINFEEVYLKKNLDTLINSYNAFLEIVKPDKKPFLILDEVQEIPEWERFVRSIHEKNQARIIVSGSSAKLMSEELSTLLAGRDIPIEVYPLSFKEYLHFNNIKIENQLDLITKKSQMLQLLWRYLELGGFPEVTLEKNVELKKEILKRYFETILIKDVQRRFRIKDTSTLENIAFYYLSNVSSLISYTKTAKTLKIPTTTLTRYSKHLQTSRMIFFIDKLTLKPKEKLISLKKVYAIDNGLPKTIGIKTTEKIGSLLENLVAIELQRRYKKPTYEINYYRDYQQREVDFTIKEGLKIKQLIQVTYASNLDEIEKRELRNLIKARETLNCKNLLIITWDLEDQIIYKGEKIKLKPIWKWLLKQTKNETTF